MKKSQERHITLRFYTMSAFEAVWGSIGLGHIQ